MGAEYLCADNVLKAHAEVYHLYREKYHSRFGGKIGITLSSNFYYPAHPKGDSTDEDMVNRALQFQVQKQFSFIKLCDLFKYTFPTNSLDCSRTASSVSQDTIHQSWQKQSSGIVCERDDHGLDCQNGRKNGVKGFAEARTSLVSTTIPVIWSNKLRKCPKSGEIVRRFSGIQICCGHRTAVGCVRNPLGCIRYHRDLGIYCGESL